jgi:pyrroline-5-carboxylate reductase
MHSILKNEPKPRVGFLGVGTIAEALVLGMCAGGEHRADFVLSPRNAQISRSLADRYSFVTVAEDNQGVVDGSDIVFLAIRPQVAESVIAPLRFRAEQTVVSLIGTFSTEKVSHLVGHVRQICRAIPMPAVAKRKGVLTLYQMTAETLRLMEGLGRVIQVEQESDLEALWAATSLMGSYFGFMGSVVEWVVAQGVPESEARVFVAEVFEPLAAVAVEHPERSFSVLAREYSTLGGLNEQAHRELKAAEWLGLVQEALDLIHARILGKATLESRIASRG